MIRLARMLLLALVPIGTTLAESVSSDPPCAPAESEICRVMNSGAFVASYRRARGEAVQAEDVVDVLTATLHDIIVGRFHAGAAAVGRQVEAALDQWLVRTKRICGDPRAFELAPRAIAEHLSTAARSFGASIEAEDLGMMTGTVLALVDARGLRCVCAAQKLSELPTKCSSARSQ
jgi:hypothetical protein